MAYKSYENPEELRHLQEVSVLILDELDRVCRELNIPYFLYAGTLIGAIRHKGFIPWDDDIDIAFLRKDYERLLREAPAILNPRFELVDGIITPDFPACNSNLALRDTVCVPEELKTCKYKYKISIGLYALDKVSEHKNIFNKQKHLTWLYGRLSFLVATPHPYVAQKGVLRAVILSVCAVAHYLLKLAGVTSEWIHKKWNEAAQLASSESVDLYADFTDMNPLAWSFKEKEIFPLIEVEYEGRKFFAPNAYDEVLTRGYGNYMELPPEDKRKNHYPSALDFGPY